MHPYAEPITTVQESAADVVEYQMTRDRHRFFYEKQKLALLIVLMLTLWIMFFLLWGKLDELAPIETAPPAEHQEAPPLSDPPSHFHRDDQDPVSPIYAI